MSNSVTNGGPPPPEPPDPRGDEPDLAKTQITRRPLGDPLEEPAEAAAPPAPEGPAFDEDPLPTTPTASLGREGTPEFPAGEAEEETLKTRNLQAPPEIADLPEVARSAVAFEPELLPRDPKSKTAPFYPLRKLGSGGYGSVWLYKWGNRLEAWKILRRKGEEANEAARGELNVTDKKHERVVLLYGLDERDGKLVVRVEYIEGHDLDDHVRRKGVVTSADAIRVGREMAGALGYIHGSEDAKGLAKEVLHLDVKPRNIVLSEDGHATLIDFGISVRRSAGDQQVGYTQRYSAPEIKLLPAAELDRRADVFSLGATLFFLLRGRSPDKGVDVASELRHVPPALCELISRMLSQDRDSRPRSMREVDAELERLEREIVPEQTAFERALAAEDWSGAELRLARMQEAFQTAGVPQYLIALRAELDRRQIELGNANHRIRIALSKGDLEEAVREHEQLDPLLRPGYEGRGAVREIHKRLRDLKADTGAAVNQLTAEYSFDRALAVVSQVEAALAEGAAACRFLVRMLREEQRNGLRSRAEKLRGNEGSLELDPEALAAARLGELREFAREQRRRVEERGLRERETEQQIAQALNEFDFKRAYELVPPRKTTDKLRRIIGQLRDSSVREVIELHRAGEIRKIRDEPLQQLRRRDRTPLRKWKRECVACARGLRDRNLAWAGHLTAALRELHEALRAVDDQVMPRDLRPPASSDDQTAPRAEWQRLQQLREVVEKTDAFNAARVAKFEALCEQWHGCIKATQRHLHGSWRAVSDHAFDLALTELDAAAKELPGWCRTPERRRHALLRARAAAEAVDRLSDADPPPSPTDRIGAIARLEGARCSPRLLADTRQLLDRVLEECQSLDDLLTLRAIPLSVWGVLLAVQGRGDDATVGDALGKAIARVFGHPPDLGETARKVPELCSALRDAKLVDVLLLPRCAELQNHPGIVIAKRLLQRLQETEPRALTLQRRPLLAALVELAALCTGPSTAPLAELRGQVEQSLRQARLQSLSTAALDFARGRWPLVAAAGLGFAAGLLVFAPRFVHHDREQLVADMVTGAEDQEHAADWLREALPSGSKLVARADFLESSSQARQLTSGSLATPEQRAELGMALLHLARGERTLGRGEESPLGSRDAVLDAIRMGVLALLRATAPSVDCACRLSGSAASELAAMKCALEAAVVPLGMVAPEDKRKIEELWRETARICAQRVGAAQEDKDPDASPFPAPGANEDFVVNWAKEVAAVALVDQLQRSVWPKNDGGLDHDRIRRILEALDGLQVAKTLKNKPPALARAIDRLAQ